MLPVHSSFPTTERFSHQDADSPVSQTLCHTGQQERRLYQSVVRELFWWLYSKSTQKHRVLEQQRTQTMLASVSFTCLSFLYLVSFVIGSSRFDSDCHTVVPAFLSVQWAAKKSTVSLLAKCKLTRGLIDWCINSLTCTGQSYNLC